MWASEMTELKIENSQLKIENEEWPELPTETEIYILPDGTVVVADMPTELADLVSELGTVLPCEIPADAQVGQDG